MKLLFVIVKKINNKFIAPIILDDISIMKQKKGMHTKKSSHNNGSVLEAINGLIQWTIKCAKFSYLKYPGDKRIKKVEDDPKIIMK
jgi:hypothetical protein